MAKVVKLRSGSLQKSLAKVATQVAHNPNSMAHRIFWGAFAESLFEQIYKAFKIKSQLGIDNLGERWADLTEEYKAYKVPADLTITRQMRARDKSQAHRGILTHEQNKQWKKIFARIYHKLKNKEGEEDAKAIAAGVAWNVVKQMGGKTKLEVFGTRTVPVNIRTKRLINSLKPGKYSNRGYKKPTKDQVFEVSTRKLQLGTNVPYAKYVDALRPLWSYDIDPWIDKALDDAISALSAKLHIILEKQ